MRVLLSRSIERKLIENEPNKDPDEVKRLFGTSKNPIQYSRLQFFDAFLINADELKDIGTTEVKFENTISRSTSVANPRQIERVVRGAKFAFMLTYEAVEEKDIEKDFKNIAKAIELLQADYLGGHGTRGYGRVVFYDFNVERVAGDIDDERLSTLNACLDKVAQKPA